jgi:hypothetical protein
MKIHADAEVISPTQMKVAWKAGSTSIWCAPFAPKPAWNVASSAPAEVTARLIDSICTIDSIELPLLALAPDRSFSATVFMAVNWIELTMPKMASCTSVSASGRVGEISAKDAIVSPTTKVLTTSTRR